MNKIIILILCLCCAFTIARAEEGPALNPSDANIVGHVVDRKTGEHLSFITIFLKGTTIGTSTDGTGHYYLKNLPEGEFTVVMKTMGYKTIETPVMLKKGRTLEINFEVEEEALSLDGKSFLVAGVLSDENSSLTSAQSMAGSSSDDETETVTLEGYIPYSALTRIADNVLDITQFYVSSADE